MNVPTVVYEGILDHEVIAKVRENQYGLKEGVVFKNEKHMFKLKTNDWLNKVKAKYGDARYKEEMK